MPVTPPTQSPSHKLVVVSYHCPLPSPGLEEVEILDQAGLHRGDAHPRAGRTCRQTLQSGQNVPSVLLPVTAWQVQGAVLEICLQ